MDYSIGTTIIQAILLMIMIFVGYLTITEGIIPLTEKTTEITIKEFCETNGGIFEKGLGLLPPLCLIEEKPGLYERYGFNNWSNGYYNIDCKLVKYYGGR